MKKIYVKSFKEWKAKKRINQIKEYLGAALMLGVIWCLLWAYLAVTPGYY